MSKEVIVESFELDHTIVKAPYVRLIGEETGPKGDIISNFDIRLVQPNEDSIPTAGLHTIEHLLAKLIRTRIDGMIDCSPFGCRTGFHMIMWGRHSSAEIAAVIKDSLKEIAETTTWEDVPGTTIESCRKEAVILVVSARFDGCSRNLFPSSSLSDFLERILDNSCDFSTGVTSPHNHVEACTAPKW